MFIASYIRSSEAILNAYKGDLPFGAFLKNYFRENKKHGSRDRKIITSFCYAYFRLGKAFAEYTAERKITYGYFLQSTQPNPVMEELSHELNLKAHLSLEEKLAFIAAGQPLQIFPFSGELSENIPSLEWDRSMLIQPDLFLRIRPGFETRVLNKLKLANINYSLLDQDYIVLPSTTPVQNFLQVDKEVVVQDYNSAQVIKLLSKANFPAPNFQAWDCCAASGGKSILLHDVFPQASINVSDIRPSILHNLKQRFLTSGIKKYTSFLADLTMPLKLNKNKFDLIICDAPCSGSGTWARTPEQMLFFREEQIIQYAARQRTIVNNVIPALKKGGFLLYITCSVFKKENEELVDFITAQTALTLVHQQYFTGYHFRADTLFAALFQL